MKKLKREIAGVHRFQSGAPGTYSMVRVIVPTVPVMLPEVPDTVTV